MTGAWFWASLNTSSGQPESKHCNPQMMRIRYVSTGGAFLKGQFQEFDQMYLVDHTKYGPLGRQVRIVLSSSWLRWFVMISGRYWPRSVLAYFCHEGHTSHERILGLSRFDVDDLAPSTADMLILESLKASVVSVRWRSLLRRKTRGVTKVSRGYKRKG